MIKDKKLTQLAKKGKPGRPAKNDSEKNQTNIKSTTPVVEEKKILTPEQERDLKAKQKVEELLQDVNLTPNKQEEEIVNEITPTNSEVKNIEWLEEQVSRLGEQNEFLKSENDQLRLDYDKLYAETQNKKNSGNTLESETYVQNIISLYMELQNNLLGHNKERVSWSTANIKILLDKLNVLFPFTEQYKKYN